MKYLLDTNIIIYLLKARNQNLLNRISVQKYGDLTISSITLAELEYGAENSQRSKENRNRFTRALAALEILDFDTMCAWHYGKIRAHLKKNGTPVGAMDMLIAATALAHNLTVITNNESEFSRIPNLKIENWCH